MKNLINFNFKVLIISIIMSLTGFIYSLIELNQIYLTEKWRLPFIGLLIICAALLLLSVFALILRYFFINTDKK